MSVRANQEVQVCDDAVFLVPFWRGPVCSGDIKEPPLGWSCPLSGDEALRGCRQNLPSFDEGVCRAMENAKCVKLTKANTWGCIFESVGCLLWEKNQERSNGVPSRFIVNGLEISCKQIDNTKENQKPTPAPTAIKTPVKRTTSPNNSAYYPSAVTPMYSFPRKNRIYSNISSSINTKSGAASGSGSSDLDTINLASSSGSRSMWGSEFGSGSVSESGIDSADMEARSGSDSESASEGGGSESSYHDFHRHHQPCKKTKAPEPCTESQSSDDEGSKSYMDSESPQPCKPLYLPTYTNFSMSLPNAVNNWTIWSNETLMPVWSSQSTTSPPVSTEVPNLSNAASSGEGENAPGFSEAPLSSILQKKLVSSEQGSKGSGETSAPSSQSNGHEFSLPENIEFHKPVNSPCIKSKSARTEEPCTKSPPKRKTTTAPPTKKSSKHSKKAPIPTAQLIDINGTNSSDFFPVSTQPLSSPEPSSSSPVEPSPEPSPSPSWFQATASSPIPSVSTENAQHPTSIPPFVSNYAICHVVRRVH